MNELLSKLQRCGIVWIAAVMLTQMTAAAQSVLLTGKVVDTDGAPVIGAGIISMQNKAAGTTTDLDGKFSFKVPAGTESVLFSSVGMKDVVYRITPGKTEDITIVMEWESTQLDQVVVTGYAQTTVKRITGSVAVINSDKFEAKAISSVDALMQGEVAGVAVSATSGQPGTQSRIRIPRFFNSSNQLISLLKRRKFASDGMYSILRFSSSFSILSRSDFTSCRVCSSLWSSFNAESPAACAGVDTLHG